MSLDNLSSENRTRNNMIRLHTNITRCCSFCRKPNHNVNTCNDDRLVNFENECRVEKERFEMSSNSRFMFRNWICDKSIMFPHTIRSFAVRKCGSTIRDNINLCIDNIIRYIYLDSNDVNENIENNNINEDSFESLLRVTNFILNTIPNYTEGVANDFSALMRFGFGYDYGNEAENVNYRDAELLLHFRNYVLERRSKKFTFISKLEETNDDIEETCECAICYEDGIKNINFIKLNCNHKFCNLCLKKSIENTQYNMNPCCALCRTEIKILTFKDENIKNEFCKNSSNA